MTLFKSMVEYIGKEDKEMLRDKHRTEIKVGNWLQDTEGIYEVTKVGETEVEVVEIIFEGDGDEYTKGETWTKTKVDLQRTEVIG